MKQSLSLKWACAPLATALILLATGCGGDEPEPAPETPPETEQPGPETPENPDTPDEPEKPAEPDQPATPDGDKTKYHVPEENEFLGPWRVYWQKCETWRYFYGKWTKTEEEIEDEAYIQKQSGFPYFIAFVRDAWDQNRIIWGSGPAAIYYNDVLKLVAEKGSGHFEGLYVEDGLFSGDAMQWIWYPEANTDVSMIVLKSGKNVSYRWKITQFDGDSFTVSPAFYDFPKGEDGDIHFFYTRKYRRFVPQN